MSDINALIAEAASLYNAELHAFSTKSAQKRAMERLNYAYEVLRRADHTALIDKLNAEGLTDMGPESARWAEIEKRELPFNLHQYRPAKHDVRWLSALRCEVAGQLVTLRQQYKSAEILPKAVSEQQLIAKEERAASAAAKDDGFRVAGLSCSHVFCQNEKGTQWFRCDWYRNGSKISFLKVHAYIAACRRYWMDNGRPDQSDWTHCMLTDFYRECRHLAA